MMEQLGKQFMQKGEDDDMCVPFTGSEAWTRSIGYKIVDEWRPWIYNGQVAGYLQGYENNLTFLTIKWFREQGILCQIINLKKHCIFTPDSWQRNLYGFVLSFLFKFKVLISLRRVKLVDSSTSRPRMTSQTK